MRHHTTTICIKRGSGMAKPSDWKWSEKTVKEISISYDGGCFEIRKEKDGNNEYTAFLDQDCFAVNESLAKLKTLCELYMETNGYLPNG